MIRVAHLFRHPIKGLGSEPIQATDLNTDRPLPLDRQWAVLQEGQRNTGTWQKRRTFGHVARGPKLSQISCCTDGTQIALSHPDLPSISINPDKDGRALLDWLRPIWGSEMQPASELIRAPDTGMTDADYPSVSLMNLASLSSLQPIAGCPIDPRRFRGNIWLDELPPWKELDWTGKRLRLGSAKLEIIEPIIRCRAIEANPTTGDFDTNLTKLLNAHWDHVYFGVNARVTKSGHIRCGDTLEI